MYNLVEQKFFAKSKKYDLILLQNLISIIGIEFYKNIIETQTKDVKRVAVRKSGAFLGKNNKENAMP